MHEKPTIEISVSEYFDLAKSKATADALLSLIHNKQRHYEGFSIEEVRTLDRLYFMGEEA
jgi:hypothetical protein